MKKLLMAISMLLLLTMMPFALFGCDSEEKTTDPADIVDNTEVNDDGAEKPTEKPTEGTELDENDPYAPIVKERNVHLGMNFHANKVKKLGRTVTLTSGIACDHTASGIEFRGVMKGSVKLEIQSAQIKSNSPKSYFTVYIDGVRQEKRYEVQGVKKLEVANFSEEGEHLIRIVKQDEANYTNSVIKKISFEGYLLTPPENKDLYIEFIGDSLTCGMGNIGLNNSPEAQSAQWEDGSKSYGYMLAEELDADYSIVSESGIGISGSWSDHDMVDYWPKASYIRDKSTAQKFDRVPDLVVINLVTNDYYINKDKDKNLCTTAMVTAETEKFIGMVREAYGKDVPIIWASKFVGIGDNYVAAFEEGIKNYAAKKLGNCATVADAEAAGIYRINLTQNTGGAQWHPDVSGHTKAASELSAFIASKKILG